MLEGIVATGKITNDPAKSNTDNQQKEDSRKRHKILIVIHLSNQKGIGISQLIRKIKKQ